MPPSPGSLHSKIVSSSTSGGLVCKEPRASTIARVERDVPKETVLASREQHARDQGARCECWDVVCEVVDDEVIEFRVEGGHGGGGEVALRAWCLSV